MSVTHVLKLDEYRDRRIHRQEKARAFLGRDVTRARLFDHLSELSELTGSDRVAAVWIDEFGQGLVHPFLVLDTLSDRPRRLFAPEPLHRAWECGVPGACDHVFEADSRVPATFSIALGSDGARSWFVVADSATRKRPLDEASRERVMFLAGECSALVLHRDLDAPDRSNEPTFEGWPVLVDLEGREDDEAQSRLVNARFIVGRLARMLIEEDFVVAATQRLEQAGAAREDLRRAPPDDAEDRRLLHDVLDAYEREELDALAPALQALGAAAERRDHVSGAVELYECAFETASATGDAAAAIDAARASGRVLRRRARWQEADEWYELALAVARSAELHPLVARSLAGLGLVRRERGNLPAARECLEEALRVAEFSGDGETIANVHHDFMGLEQQTGDLSQALRHGWRAVTRYRSDDARTRCMAGIAGVLIEVGDLSAAEDAWMLVLAGSSEVYYRVYAAAGLAHVGALRGSEADFERWSRRCDEEGWDAGPPSAKAEILHYRGLGYGLLGRPDDARAWLNRAIDFAESRGFSRVLFQAEAALEDLAVVPEPKESGRAPAPAEVRDGLRAMRLAEVAGGV
jgi:tetratricopeptide (TPR) repeat protein